MAKIENLTYQQLVRMWKSGNSHTLMVAVYTGTITLENSLAFSSEVEGKHSLSKLPQCTTPKAPLTSLSIGIYYL